MKQINVPLNNEDLDSLRKVAGANGMPMTSQIRQWIRAEAAKLERKERKSGNS